MTLDELSWASVDQSVNVGISIDDIKYKPSCILANDRHVTVLFNSFSGISRLEIDFNSDTHPVTKYYKRTQIDIGEHINFPLYMNKR